MVMNYRYISVGTTAFNVDLGNTSVRLGSIQGFSGRAEHAAVGSSSIIIDNPSGTVGYNSDQIIGLQQFKVTESDCSAGNQLLFMGYIGPRKYRRGSGPNSSLRTTVANQIECTLFDLNAVLGFRVIPQSDTAANRPRETISARLTWILGSSYLSGLVADNGLVVYPTTITMDAADYRGQRPSNVINDCELAGKYWAFVYPDETKTTIASLFFDDANASTAYSTSLRLTNNLADVDNTTTFAVNDDFELSRDPTDTGSGVFEPYARGAVYVRRTASEALYGRRDMIAPNANVKTAARATATANDYAFQHRNEEDRISGTVRIPSQYVNNLRYGQRLQVKFTHLPGYTDWTWVRALMVAPGQRQESADFYDVAVELSPQEGGCSTQPAFVQLLYEDGTSQHAPLYSEDHTLAAAPTPGNLLVVACMAPEAFSAYLTAAPTGWNWAVQNTDSNHTHGTGDYCNVIWKVCTSTADQTVTLQFGNGNGGRRVAFAEYSGLTNPTLYAAAVSHIDDPGLGYAIIPATTYPSGPALVLAAGFLEDGPTSSDHLGVSGTGLTLRSDIAGGLHGAGEVGIADDCTAVGASGGTTPLYPAAGGWRFTFTGTFPTNCYGLVFVGDNC